MSTRIAIVAGAGGGRGQATPRALHSSGLSVVAVDRTETGLKELPADIHRELADATDPSVAGPLVERIADEVGPPDILVNTIGSHQLGDALTVTPETLRQLMDVNLGAALWLTQAVVPHMQRKKSGVIVHVGARAAIEPIPGAAAYGITKAALVHLTRILDVELRAHGIRVNAVLPQLISTARNRSALPPELLADAVPPEAIADVIATLVSDQFASTGGAIIPVYGG
jgi:NAD(P)-dependent dehydrogenase (short-subunit alcohol dehydrogenase family)